LSNAKAGDSPVVGKIVSFARSIHGKIIGGDTYLPAKLKTPGKFLP
jgi:hypothetical protein